MLLKTAQTAGMVVSYPTHNLDLGLLFLYGEDIDLSEFDGDSDLRELASTVPDPKFLPIPQTPPASADQRFELLR